MTRLPCPSTRKAPSPRTASDTSTPRSPLTLTGGTKMVGWNCMNSRSRPMAPARRAAAKPTPLTTSGFVVAFHSWPIPPVARMTAKAETTPNPRRESRTVAPQARPSPSTRTSHNSQSSRTFSSPCPPVFQVAPSMAATFFASVISISWPEASPLECRMRRAECPPSRCKSISPAALRSKRAPIRIIHCRARGAS